ncbi:S-layer homology domain-containing protein [Butyricicoccus pullicaecorum]|uniref:S-layer homology domain-containing protein n=1 Tax=Butyricicoccus pullicaecorum TaxID=501571 RepID=UPI0035230EF4
MKNLKKVLAMVLAFACTFSMFAGAKVFEDVPAGSDYSEAITMLSDLGVIQGKDDGKYHPEDTITRAEACAMIARLMTGDPNVSQYVGAQSFSDVQKGSWKDSAIGYCYINGIVIGVGNNKFEPDRAITDAEFVTMVVRAMGYETADMKQNYPFSYMSNAQAMGLLDGTNMVASTDALRGEDAQVIYNALFADYARGAKLVNTTHGTSVETYPTLAESVWGLERAAVGTWNKKDDEDATLSNCKAHTWVVLGADPTAEGRIVAYPIDDDTTDIYTDGKGSTYSFKYDGDASAVAGYQVELWGEGNHGEPTWESKNDKYVWSEDWTIKAIKTVKGQKAYDYNASMADKKDDNGEIVLGEETLKLESVADNAKVAEKVQAVDQYLYEGYHGQTKLSDEKVEKALNVRDGAQYKLVDWDSDGDIDWVVASTANYYKVEAVHSTRVTVSSMKTGNEETQTDSDSQTWKLNDLTEINKVKYDFKTEADLAEGDIIEVTYADAYNKGEKEEVVTATITKVEADTAELDKVSTKDDLELTFDGEVKKVAQANDKGDVVVPANPKTYGDFDDEELGTSFNLWTNRNGFIVYSDYANETVNYLMVLDTGAGSDKTGDRKLATMDVLFADDSTKKDVEVVSDLDLDGYNEKTREWTEEKVVGNVYKYWQDEDGTITKMESMFSKDAKYDSNYTYDESADRLKDTDGFVASLEEADVIFAVTSNYIDKTSGLKVDDSKVMAVKQSDIPEIDAAADNTTDDAKLVDAVSGTWLANKGYTGDVNYVAEVDKNGEASAAILGVKNFNKFNAASTTVGLVTSVSYDKNDVVEIEVAYKGEVTTVKSAEDVDFEDIVKQFNGSEDVDLSTKQAANKLKDNALYAEITTDADGKLTAVTFMNVDGDTATGHYYEASRRIISDVKSGNVAFGDGEFLYYNNKNLYSVGRLPVADADLANDVYYYTIDGRPTTHDDKYTDVVLSVANGFDGTPDIEAATDSTLIESYVNDKFDDVDDYQVADLVTKIDGDIVAAYAFEDTLGEVPIAETVKVNTTQTALTKNFATAMTSKQVGTWSKIGNGADATQADIVAVEDTNTAGVKATLNDGKINVEADAAATACKFVVVLKDADGKEVGRTETITLSVGKLEVTAEFTKARNDSTWADVELAGVTIEQLKAAGVTEKDFTAVEYEATTLDQIEKQKVVGADQVATADDGVRVSFEFASAPTAGNTLKLVFAGNDNIVITATDKIVD